MIRPYPPSLWVFRRIFVRTHVPANFMFRFFVPGLTAWVFRILRYPLMFRILRYPLMFRGLRYPLMFRGLRYRTAACSGVYDGYRYGTAPPMFGVYGS